LYCCDISSLTLRGGGSCQGWPATRPAAVAASASCQSSDGVFHCLMSSGATTASLATSMPEQYPVRRAGNSGQVRPEQAPTRCLKPAAISRRGIPPSLVTALLLRFEVRLQRRARTQASGYGSREIWPALEILHRTAYRRTQRCPCRTAMRSTSQGFSRRETEGPWGDDRPRTEPRFVQSC
jgi:hypothetical protein